MNRQLFPLGKAYGEAFCNREQETAWLVGNIQHNKHTLLIAPRRYGKSSLAERAIDVSGLASAKANFHLCTSAEEVADLIKSCAIHLISQAVSKVSTLVPLLQKWLKTLHPRVSFYRESAVLELVSEAHENYAVTIAETLQMLDRLLAEKQRRAVLFFDEFQEIANISPSDPLEGAIRTAAQELQQLTIIFSGSLRSLLMNMFEDERRPLYKLCRKMHLTRISSLDYEQHLQTIAQSTWGRALAPSSLEAIFSCSARHPYFLNYLCDTLWQQSTEVPDAEMVRVAWQQVLLEEWSDAVREIATLPMVQRRLIREIAQTHPSQLLSRETSMNLKLPLSSISTALSALIEKDYLERDAKGRYEIINPLLRAALMKGDVA
jgi:DNA-binding IclR family transcriptional regulator